MYYLSLRGLYGGLLAHPTMVDDLHEQQRRSELEKLEAEMSARIAAESDRDFYLHMMNTINANNPSLIFAKDLEGRYLMVNEAYERALDLRAEDLLGQTDEAVNPELAPAWRASDLRARQGRYHVDEIGEGPEGLRHYDSVKFPLFDSSGELYATCGVSLDVTRLRQTNEALAEARDDAVAAVAVKSAFLATMSHELRTPMNAVIGMTDLLLHTSLDAEQEELVATVHTSGEALLAVIDDILDFSRLESSGPQLRAAAFGLREEIRQAATMVAATAPAGVEVVWSVEDSCPESVVGDRDRVRQILVNVVANAVKFTPRGEVRLTAHAEPLGEGGLRVVVEVCDTGIGISPAGLDMLFISFSQVDASATRSYGGTGLGLAVSRRLARAMGGDITVVSTPGEGSTFTVIVVVQADREQDAEPPELRSGAGAAQCLRVLLAEDNAVNQRVAQLMLAQLGHTVETVANGQEAVEAVLAGSYDVVLMDLQMPGLDGLAATRRIRAEVPVERQPHIIAMTASILGEDRLASAAAGAESYLPKPVRPSALREALERAQTSPAPDRFSGPPGSGPLDEKALDQLREDLDD